MLKAQDIRGMYAILPTPAKPGADRLDATDTVDLEATEQAVNAVLRDGSTGLIVLGTTGECGTLSDPDYRTFAASVLEIVKRRVPVIVGTSGMGGHEVVRRMRFARDLGADAALVGLPTWQPCTLTMAVDFYAQMSKVFPDFAVMAYANARAFRYDFPLDFWKAVAKEAPTVTSAKYSRVAGLRELLDATERRINFVPNEMFVDQFHAISPETTTASWATAAAMNPKPAIALMEALQSGNAEATRDLVAAIAWANQPVEHIFNKPELFAHYNIQLEKTRINAAGYIQCGPTRPPYADFPEPYASQARECGQRWTRVCEAYAGGLKFSSRPWQD